MPTTRKGRLTLKRTSVFLAKGQLDRLAALHTATGVPVAVMIRRAVDAYLASAAGAVGRRAAR